MLCVCTEFPMAYIFSVFAPEIVSRHFVAIFCIQVLTEEKVGEKVAKFLQ